MHEIALVHAAARGLIDEVAGATVTAVVLAIGPDVERDVAQQAWTQAVDGTSVAGATLTFIDVLDELQCLDCAHTYPGDRLSQCPKCGATGLVVGEAEEVSVASWSS